LRRRTPRWFDLLVLGAIAIVLTMVGVAGFGGCCGCRSSANEAGAIASLKNLATAQQRFRDEVRRDLDGDGRGEFGWFAELTGAAAIDGMPPSRVRAEPLLTAAFRKVAAGRVQRSGYWFAVFLPGPGGVWLGEAEQGAGAGRVLDVDAAERDWVAYAWPVEPARTGARTFLVRADGVVWYCGRMGRPDPLMNSPVPGRSGWLVMRDPEQGGEDAFGVVWQRVR
jgi:hypothetical protein